MGFFSKFEGRVEDTFEGAANKMFDAPISPVQIAKKAEKQMRREKVVGAGKQIAPTLYTVLVNPDDDQRLFGYYPTLAGETETYLAAKAGEEGLHMDGHPLVRFIVDDALKHGKFDVIAELVSAPIIQQLRAEEMERYGLGGAGMAGAAAGGAGMGAAGAYNQPQRGAGRPMAGGRTPQQDPYAPQDYGYDYGDPYAPQGAQGKPPLPYVPDEEIDYSIDYGEYTFDSQDFDDYRENGVSGTPLPYNNDQGYAQDDYYPENEPVGTRDSLGFANQPRNSAGFPNQQRSSVPLAGQQRSSVPFPAGGAAAAGAMAGAAGAAAAGAMGGAPNTVVFASGGGNANPLPGNAPIRARLINATTGRTYDLAATRYIIGRESSNDIVVDDINASRAHAELRYEPQGVWVLADLGSTNGTLINGIDVVAQPLHEGDRISIGMTNFIFSMQ